MVYFNIGHNDMDYEHHTNKDLSHTFPNPVARETDPQFIDMGGDRQEGELSVTETPLLQIRAVFL